MEDLAKGADHSSRECARLIVRCLSNALQRGNQRCLPVALQAPCDGTNGHRLSRDLALDRQRISEELDVSPGAHICHFDGPRLASYESGGMEGHG